MGVAMIGERKIKSVTNCDETDPSLKNVKNDDE